MSKFIQSPSPTGEYQTRFKQADNLQSAISAFGLSPWADPTPTNPRRVVSKLFVRRKLRELGKEEAFDALLDSIPNARKDWDDATELHTDDPLFTTAAPVIKAALSLTDEQFTSLIT